MQECRNAGMQECRGIFAAFLEIYRVILERYSPQNRLNLIYHEPIVSGFANQPLVTDHFSVPSSTHSA
jgi:hypothetical protein